MKEGYINPIYKLAQRDADTVPRKISFSQLSIYEKCPRHWKLAYIDKLSPFNYSIETVFGTAMHETLQEYLIVLFTDSVKASNRLDLPEMLKTNLRNEYMKGVEANGGEHFSTPAELEEYLLDGIAIINWVVKRRAQYFSTKYHELVGIEISICEQATQNNPSVFMYGFLDIVIRDTHENRIKIIDIKTSRNGWNKWQKADKLKAAQLIIYKNYYAEQFGVPIDSIDVEFMIVKRKLQEDSMFPQKRVQIIRPSSGKVTQKKVQQMVDKFVAECFDDKGNKNEDREYMAIAGKGAKHCKWCPFKTDFENCPKENRIRE